MNGTKQLLYISAGVEALTGIVAFASPSTVVWLLWAVPLTVGGRLIGQLAGIALISLTIACWPRGTVNVPSVRGLTVYNGLAAVFFLVIALRTAFVGILLWPAIVFHATMAVLFVLAWRRATVVAR